jgi:aerobic carbon-monoxide dehydrogenase medium subunit
MEGELYSVSSVPEVCDLLAKYGQDAKVLAGGTDLMVLINRRMLVPPVIVYIGNCGLGYIKQVDGDLVIGAGSTFTEIVKNELVNKHAPVLARAVKMAGSPAIRNAATLGGNLANASPAADSAVALLALGARFKLVSKTDERLIDCADFFTGPGQTVLQPDELLEEVIVPAKPEGVKMGYRKLGQRKAEICAVASVAVVLEGQNGSYGKTTIAMGSVAPTPILITAARQLVDQKRGDLELILSVAEAAAAEIQPIDDVRASAWYRRKASAAIVKQTLEWLG